MDVLSGGDIVPKKTGSCKDNKNLRYYNGFCSSET